MSDPVWLSSGKNLLKQHSLDSFRIPAERSTKEFAGDESSEEEGGEDHAVLPKATQSTGHHYHDSRRPFRFSGHRTRIDWRALYGIDVDEVYENTDLDALDRIVSVLCHGDLCSEDPANLTHLNFIKLFRLSQLTIEYLLYVQDTLVLDYNTARKEKHQVSQHLKACRYKIKDQSVEIKSLRKELKQIKRHVQTYEILAATNPFSNAVSGGDEDPKSEKTTWHPRMLDVLQEFKVLGNEKSEIRSQMIDMKRQLEDLWKVQSDVHQEHVGETRKLKQEFTELTSLLAELNETKKENQALKSNQAQLQTTVADMTQSNHALTKQISCLEDTVSMLKEEKEFLVVRSKEDIGTVRSLKAELSETRTNLSDCNSRLSLAERESLSQKTATLNKEKEIENMIGEKETMQKLLEAQEERLKSMELLKSKLRKERLLVKQLQQDMDQRPTVDTEQIVALRIANKKLKEEVIKLQSIESMDAQPVQTTPSESLQPIVPPSFDRNQKNTAKIESREDGSKPKDSWKKFLKRFPAVMPWNKALRARNIHKQEDFKNLSLPISANIESAIGCKINSMGVDCTAERLDEETFQEAMEVLEEDIMQKQMNFTSEEKDEYDTLTSAIDHHLENHRPAKELKTEHFELDPNSVSRTSEGWASLKTVHFSPKAAEELNFSPLSNGLLRGASRDLGLRHSSITKEAGAQPLLNRSPSPPPLKAVAEEPRLWSVLKQAASPELPSKVPGDEMLSPNRMQEEDDESGLSEYTSNETSVSGNSPSAQGASASVGSRTLTTPLEATKLDLSEECSDLEDEYSLDFDTDSPLSAKEKTSPADLD